MDGGGKEGGYDWTTEGKRFNQQPMCTDLTGECARRWGSALRKGGDTLQVNLDSNYTDVGQLSQLFQGVLRKNNHRGR